MKLQNIYIDDGLKKGEIGWSVHNVKEVKIKEKIFARGQYLKSEIDLGTDDSYEC
jgi:hypothetical protein